MDFDQFSGFLVLAAFSFGLIFLLGRLWANRNINVTCILHEQHHM